MRSSTRALLAFLLGTPLVLGHAPASAHEYWLAPSRWSTHTRSPVAIGAVAGTGFCGERRPYPATRVVRFVARAGRMVDLRPLGGNGELVWARFASADDAGALVAYESDFVTLTLDAASFDDYLAMEGLDGPLATRRAGGAATPGRERYRRCAKAWLTGNRSARATAPLGMPMEIVPLAAPGADPVLRVRVTYGGRPLAGTLVKAWRTALATGDVSRDPATRDSVGVSWQGRSDFRGEVAIPVVKTGEWLVSAVHMVPSRDPSADWESTWASLAFARLR